MATTERGKKEFGRLLRQQRAARNLRQYQLADRMGVDQTTIAKWERGDGVPATRLAELSDALAWDFGGMLALYHGVDSTDEVPPRPAVDTVMSHIDALRDFFVETQARVDALQARVEDRDEARETYVRELERRNAELNALLEQAESRSPQPAA